jgi:hypothetical protein
VHVCNYVRLITQLKALQPAVLLFSPRQPQEVQGVAAVEVEAAAAEEEAAATGTH